MIKIIDNFLTKSYYERILTLLEGFEIEWWYLDNITGRDEKHTLNSYGFTHPLWDVNKGPVSRFSSLIESMMYQILDATDCDFILRARADMVTWSKDEFIHPPHADFEFPNTASILYINETDGDTIFYNEDPIVKLKEVERVSPKPNRLVLFEGNLLHTGCSPTKHKNRILINSNYIKKEYSKEFKAEDYSL